MREPLDIAICGCGIGGLAAGAMLAEDGHRVRLFERFPEPAPVGSGLLVQPTGQAVLETLGLGEALRSLGDRIDRLHGEADGRAVLSVDYASARRPGMFAVGIHRSALFQCLLDAALERGVEIRCSHPVVAIESDGRLRFESGLSDGPFDLVVDATGSRSALAGGDFRPLAFGALWATVPNLGGAALAETLTQRYRAARQMAGLLPIGRAKESGLRSVALFWSLRADALERWRGRGIADWRDRWTQLWPEAADYCAAITDTAQFSFARYNHRTLPNPVRGRLIHIGDSWHSTSPQLGQGANMALLDAFALARSLRDSDSVDSALAQTAALRSFHIRLYQAFSLLLTPLYQSDGTLPAVMRDWLLAPLSKLPLAQRLQALAVAGLFARPLGRLGLDRRA